MLLAKFAKRSNGMALAKFVKEELSDMRRELGNHLGAKGGRMRKKDAIYNSNFCVIGIIGIILFVYCHNLVF